MSDASGQPSSERAAASHHDPVQLRYALETLRSQQSLVLGVAAGAAAALAGASLWALLTLRSGQQLGLVAIALGVLVGIAVRFSGRGIDRSFGIAGGTLALLACLLGNLLVVCAGLAAHSGLPLLDVLARLDLANAVRLSILTFEPMDLIFYGVATYEGYRLAFRRLSREEQARLFPG